MTRQQLIVFAILFATMALFVWGRIRHDLVAMLALLAGVLTGVVPAAKAFSGLADDVVILVGCALIISAAIARSGVIDALMQRLAPALTTTQSQVIVLAGLAAALSGFIKNIAALAILMPLALQLARRSNVSPALLLMPLSFAALLGGLITLIAGSPNIIVSRVRAELTGAPFSMFDFTPVGVVLAIAGIAYIAVGYRLMPGDRKAAPSADTAFNITDYMTEVRVAGDSTIAGKTVADFRALVEDEVAITAIVRDDFRKPRPTDRSILREGDVLLLEGEPEALERAVVKTKVALARQHKLPDPEQSADDIAVIEAVVSPQSMLVGRTPEALRLYDRYNLNLLAVSRKGERLQSRLRDTTLRAGDVVILQGDLNQLPDAMQEFDCLPLAERKILLAQTRNGLVPAGIFAGAIVLAVTGLLPVTIAFFGAAVLILLSGALPLRDAYDNLDASILILLAALIPLSDAVKTTGGTELLAGWVSVLANGLPQIGALAVVLVAAMLVTPFLNNAATVLVMAPIAANVATRLGLSPDPFLMAVAIGASCDFLTPFGHQCNTLVMGPGGYRFADYMRLGLPLSLLIIVLGVPLIAFVWPLTGR
jgi:di/tricarboxylate transporter